jgi:UDP-hydrolysing UDP-N-acetyl-D-glucosamine 2-epimerase
MKKICYITGTRADFGLMHNVLTALNSSPNFKLSVIVTGMHLMPEFGNTIEDINKFEFSYQIAQATYDGDDRESMAYFISKSLREYISILKKIKPDILIVLGDRGEMLAGAIAGAYMRIPVAHFHGGEVTRTVDEVTRHAITKLSNIHLASSQDSASRIAKLGENKKNIYVVGAPGLEAIIKKQFTSKQVIWKKFGLSKEPLLILIHHPDGNIKVCRDRIRLIIDTISKLKMQKIIIYPNADAGGRVMIKEIEKSGLRSCKNVNHKDYLGLLNAASVLVGNSSSGIIEAPSFKLPFVNIGHRQNHRQRGANVIDVPYDAKMIYQAIQKAARDKSFRNKIKDNKNPYGEGRTSELILKIFNQISLNRLLDKQITY